MVAAVVYSDIQLILFHCISSRQIKFLRRPLKMQHQVYIKHPLFSRRRSPSRCVALLCLWYHEGTYITTVGKMTAWSRFLRIKLPFTPD